MTESRLLSHDGVLRRQLDIVEPLDTNRVQGTASNSKQMKIIERQRKETEDTKRAVEKWVDNFCTKTDGVLSKKSSDERLVYQIDNIMTNLIQTINLNAEENKRFCMSPIMCYFLVESVCACLFVNSTGQASFAFCPIEYVEGKNQMATLPTDIQTLQNGSFIHRTQLVKLAALKCTRIFFDEFYKGEFRQRLELAGSPAVLSFLEPQFVATSRKMLNECKITGMEQPFSGMSIPFALYNDMTEYLATEGESEDSEDEPIEYKENNFQRPERHLRPQTLCRQKKKSNFDLCISKFVSFAMCVNICCGPSEEEKQEELMKITFTRAMTRAKLHEEESTEDRQNSVKLLSCQTF
eukprot:GHVP01005756.1.p1 GENE.GHVP01005756.1~~GHVP01005756.1.p1  ORF type:complete len:352 (+),score=65.64 GHVP01005756.1:1654-2709(+)